VTPLSDLVATSTHLRAWLESLPPDEVAGERGKASLCPMSTFVRSCGYRVAVTGVNIVWAGSGRKSACMGRVLFEFRRLVDRTRTLLTARHCLRLLDRAEREVGG
jgi:hypothetical protein